MKTITILVAIAMMTIAAEAAGILFDPDQNGINENTGALIPQDGDTTDEPNLNIENKKRQYGDDRKRRHAGQAFQHFAGSDPKNQEHQALFDNGIDLLGN